MNIKQFTKIIGGAVLALGMTQPLNAQQQDDAQSTPQPQHELKYEHSSQPNSILYFTTTDRMTFNAPHLNLMVAPTNDVLATLGEEPKTEVDAHATADLGKSTSIDAEVAYSGRNDLGVGAGAKLSQKIGAATVSGSGLFFGTEQWYTATVDTPHLVLQASARDTGQGCKPGGYVFGQLGNFSVSAGRNPLNELYWANAGFASKDFGVFHYGLFEEGIASHTTQLGFGHPAETFSPTVQRGIAMDDSVLKLISTVAPTPSFTMNADWNLEVAVNHINSTAVTVLGGRRIQLGKYGTFGIGTGIDLSNDAKPKLAGETAYELPVKGLTFHIEGRHRPVSGQNGVYVSVDRKF